MLLGSSFLVGSFLVSSNGLCNSVCFQLSGKKGLEARLPWVHIPASPLADRVHSWRDFCEP